MHIKLIITMNVKTQLISATLLAFGINSIVASENPNIVLFLMDDMGYGDLSYTGAEGYVTPNIDKIASEGMFFSHFYAAAPISTASRAGLLTGCYPIRVGMPGCLLAETTRGLNTEEEIIPELLNKVGYHCGLIGKWHLGSVKKWMPLSQGFDEFFGLPYSNDIWPVYYDGVNISEHDDLPPSEKNKANWPQLPIYEGNAVIGNVRTLDDQNNLTTLYTKRAIKFINDNHNKPFFLEISHNMPHVPLGVSSKFKGKSKIGMYGDVMMEIDWSVGEIVKALKKNKLENNTIIIITSDNGPWLTFGNHSGSTRAFREGKQTTFEGGQRVPCIVYWPNHVPSGVVNPQLSSMIDILPTLCSITGAPLPKKKIDGIDISSLWKGETQVSPRKSFFYYFSENPLYELMDLEAVRDGRFKLVFSHKYKSNEANGAVIGKNGFPGKSVKTNTDIALYDLRYDPGERMDVKYIYPEVVERLDSIADSMRNNLGDGLKDIKAQECRSWDNFDRKIKLF